MNRDRSASFVVRVVQDRRSHVSGVIERVATGAKEAFTGIEAIGGVIVRMLQGEIALSRTDSGTPPTSGRKPRPGERPPGRPVRGGATD